MANESVLKTNSSSKKLNFLNEETILRKTNNNTIVSATISPRFGTITFNVDAIRELGLVKKKIKFFFDLENRCIGFQLKTDFSSLKQMGLWRSCTINSAGVLKFSISAIINEFKRKKKLDINKLYRKVPISLYKTVGMLEDDYYYLDLKEYDRNRKTDIN